MQTRSIQLVRMALLDAGRPLTMKELVLRTGLAQATVNNVLIHEKAVASQERPARWTIEDTLSLTEIVSAPSMVLAGEGADKVIAIGINPTDGILPRWDKGRTAFTKVISSAKITPGDDPEVIYEKFSSAARTMATLAMAFYEVKDSADWYQQLGGQLEVDSA